MDASTGSLIQSGWPTAAGTAALIGEPLFDRRSLIAAVTAEGEVRDAPLARCLSHPGLGHGQKLGYLARRVEALAHRETWFPQATQPGRLVRAKSSTLEALGYMRSMSS